MADYDELYAHLDIKFYMGTKLNKRKTHEARVGDKEKGIEPNPNHAEIYDDVEMISIMFPGAKDSLHAPAHSQCSQVRDSEGMGGFVTYAEKYHRHYEHWKEHSGEQLVVGTRIDTMDFLSKGEIESLKSLKILTVEQLASADDKVAQRIGPHAHDRIEKAQAFVASQTDKTAILSEMEELKRQIAALKGEKSTAGSEDDVSVRSEPVSSDQFDGMDKEALRAWIKSNGGVSVKGQPSEDTLRKMARDLVSEAA
jgi:hypothetical protein